MSALASFGPRDRSAPKPILRAMSLLVAAFTSVTAFAPALADCADARPFFYLAFFSESLSPDQVTDFADRVAANHLRQLPGIGDVTMYGGRRLVMRITTDPSRLAAYGLALQSVEQALQSNGLEVPPQRARPETIELEVSAVDQRPPEELADIVVGQAQGVPLRLQDVAMIELTIGGGHTAATYQGREVVALGIIGDPKTGILATWYALNRWLPTFRSMMPPDMEVDLTSPFSLVIERRGE